MEGFDQFVGVGVVPLIRAVVGKIFEDKTVDGWVKVLTALAVSLVLNFGIGFMFGNDWRWIVGVSIVTAALTNLYNDARTELEARLPGRPVEVIDQTS